MSKKEKNAIQPEEEVIKEVVEQEQEAELDVQEETASTEEPSTPTDTETVVAVPELESTEFTESKNDMMKKLKKRLLKSRNKVKELKKQLAKLKAKKAKKKKLKAVRKKYKAAKGKRLGTLTKRRLSLLLEGRSYEFTLHEGDDGIELAGGAGLFHVRVEDARTHAARAKTAAAGGARGPRLVKAIMPGIVREVSVAPGDAVAKGQPLLILEAMKMQNEIRADHDGVVAKLHVSAGDTVEKGTKLVELQLQAQ